MNEHLSRRTALLAIGGATAVAAVPVTALAQSSSSAALAAKVEAYRAAEKAEYTFDEEVYLPACDRWSAACETIPHVTLEPDLYSGKRYPLSTLNAFDVADARSRTKGRYWIDPQYPDVVAHFKLLERLVAAADARDVEKQRLADLYRVDEFEAHSERLAKARNAAFDAVIEHPATTAAELAVKLAIIDESGKHECTDCWTAIIADTGRIAEREA
jgi:hypothetical protein